MRPSTITQSGTNRTFGNDEVIVSKTDLQGRLTYVNDVFLRVARYEEHEVIGKPHNMIRHPDMPRAVFELLWREIQQGHEIFAYVKNLAGDGAHYWVFAHVTPSYHRSQMIGYHSNRRLPHPSAVEAITEVYAQLVAQERRHSRPKDAIDASTALLGRLLADNNVTYDEFVWSITKVAV